MSISYSITEIQAVKTIPKNTLKWVSQSLTGLSYIIYPQIVATATAHAPLNKLSPQQKYKIMYSVASLIIDRLCVYQGFQEDDLMMKGQQELVVSLKKV